MKAARTLLASILIASAAAPAIAGPPRYRRQGAVLVETQAVAPAPSDNAPSPYLGTFYPTNYATVRGNNPIGGGYSPNGMYGTSNLVIYGPTSIYRQVAAPVVTYQRGFDGVVRASVGTTFSNPTFPGFNPVAYPTRGNLYYAPRTQRTPPQWDDSSMFIDHN